eukprot:GDKI01004935.1.p1 GENE.GDKI01004935.1~~GDKI01004935.1.p1  ORF type:complete len:179 (-),score=33.71 GDKI01004935.1:93-629(-)
MTADTAADAGSSDGSVSANSSAGVALMVVAIIAFVGTCIGCGILCCRWFPQILTSYRRVVRGERPQASSKHAANTASKKTWNNSVRKRDERDIDDMTAEELFNPAILKHQQKYGNLPLKLKAPGGGFVTITLQEPQPQPQQHEEEGGVVPVAPVAAARIQPQNSGSISTLQSFGVAQV